MANPTSQYKSCPVCSRECEKYFMFHINWYWRCPTCKIDADNPPPRDYSSPKPEVKKQRSWDDEPTDPRIMSMGGLSFSTTITALPSNCKMATIMTTKNFQNADEGDVKIHADVNDNGFASTEVFQEKFPISAMNNGHEDEMWEDLARSVLQGVLYFNVDEIKSEYLKLRLSQRYPNKRIVCV